MTLKRKVRITSEHNSDGTHSDITLDTINGYGVSTSPAASSILVSGADSTMPIQPIWDYTVSGSAITTATTNGTVTLDGNAHGGYEFEFIIINTSGSTIIPRLYYNNDTTNTNYYFTDTVGGGYANDAILGITGGILSGQRYTHTGKIYITPEGAIGIIGWRQKDLTVHESNVVLHKKAGTITNLTRIDITASVASGIGIGSRFRLWRKL